MRARRADGSDGFCGFVRRARVCRRACARRPLEALAAPPRPPTDALRRPRRAARGPLARRRARCHCDSTGHCASRTNAAAGSPQSIASSPTHRNDDDTHRHDQRLDARRTGTAAFMRPRRRWPGLRTAGALKAVPSADMKAQDSATVDVAAQSLAEPSIAGVLKILRGASTRNPVRCGEPGFALRSHRRVPVSGIAECGDACRGHSLGRLRPRAS